MPRITFFIGSVVAFALLLPLDAKSTGTDHSALTGAVSGTVTLTAARGGPSPTSVYGRRGVAPRPAIAGPETRKVVVQVSGVPSEQSPARMRAKIMQRGEQFVPPVSVVTTGSTVEFPNEDPYFHNVFSLSRAATFDLGRYPSGATRTHVFDRPGIVKVFCHIHSQMSALVVVLDHPFFTIPAETGEYTVPSVPTGEYTLIAWHERIGEQRQRIRVTAGATTRIDFTLPVLETER
jgi:plastocyanin